MPRVRLTLAGAFRQAYAAFPAARAILAEDVRVSYAELGQRAARLANALRTLGLGPGARVLLAARNCGGFLVAEHGLFAGGYVRVGISPRLHPREAAFIVQDCRAEAAFVDEDWAAHLAPLRGEMPSLRHVVTFGPELDALLAGASAEPPPLPEPEALGALLYTSGTTGKPKGAMMSQEAMAAIARNQLIDLGPRDETDLVLHVGPLAHMSGLYSWSYFLRGAGHAVLPSFKPEGVLDTIASERVTAIMLVPTMLNLLTEAAEQGDWDLSSLRTIMYGASAIAPDRLVRARRRFGEVLVQGYGLSETMLVSTLSKAAHRFDGEPPRRLASAGRPTPFVELRIQDAEGRALPPETRGEVAVRSDTLMHGYWERPEETARTLMPDGWLLTGDVGLIGEDGYLYIVDRQREMIVSGGYNVYPSEVENAISALPGVREVAVIGVPDERWGEAVHAVVVIREGDPVTEDAVRQACRDQLAAYKVPKAVSFEAELPKSPVGKILRRELRERFWVGRDRRVG